MRHLWLGGVMFHSKDAPFYLLIEMMTLKDAIMIWYNNIYILIYRYLDVLNLEC